MIVLPFPPSVNAMWRTPRTGPLAGRTLLSEDGRKYRKEVQRLATVHRWPTHDATQRLAVRITAHMPDRRRRDLDNLLKGALDALTAAGVWADDSQIDVLSIERAGELHKAGGCLQVLVDAIAQAQLSIDTPLETFADMAS